MPVIVSDTSPIRALAHLELLNLLGDLFGDVLVPPAVERELHLKRIGWPVVDLRSLPFVKVQAPSDHARVHRFMLDLDPGESEALALALEVKAEFVLMDETAGRSAAVQAGLHPIGVLGILLEAKARGRIQAVRPLVARLRKEIDFFLSESLLALVFRSAREDRA